MSLAVLLVAGAAFLIAIALPLGRIAPRDGGAEWALAWGSLYLSGAMLRVIDLLPWTGPVYPLFGTLFGGFLYAGARRYSGDPVGRSFWLALAAVGGLRGVLLLVSPPFATPLGALFVIGLASVQSARVIARSRLRRNAGAAELLLIVALPALIPTSFAYEWTKFSGENLWFGMFVWLAAACFIGGTQIATLLERYRASLEARLVERSEQLRATLGRIEEQQRLVAVGTLAAGIAHQINNPIGAIAAAAQFALLAKEDHDASGIRDEVLAKVVEEARRCGRIVKSVLQFARDEPTAKWVEDLNPVVVRACELARDYVRERGGALIVRIAEDPLLVRMSSIDLEQVVVNLVRNGAESRKEGARVEVETRRSGNEALLIVDDDGDGIDPELRSRVLEPFFTTRLEQGGSGLGLSVAHGIVADHAGRIEIEGRPRGGTRFRIRLPFAARTGEARGADVDGVEAAAQR